MPTETLHFENARLTGQLFNNDSRNLQALQDQLGVKATSREGWIKLEGSEEGITQARQLFEILESSVRAGAPVRNREFANALQVVESDGVDTLKNLYADRILTSAQKALVTPKTVGQKKYLDAIRQNDVTFGIGPAGTGKTYLAMAMALAALTHKQVSRIILARPAVEAGEHLGFLPGDLFAKVHPYLRPLYDALYAMMDIDRATRLIERGEIEIAPLAFMRGRTLDDAFVILDEAQNATTEQMKMFLTRLGLNSKAIVTGDVTQIDLPDSQKSGLAQIADILLHIDGIQFVYFSEHDVVRHPLVKAIIKAYDRFEQQASNGPHKTSSGPPSTAPNHRSGTDTNGQGPML
jgi:phosphate starvation-inducible protein PhoH and related proteins